MAASESNVIPPRIKNRIGEQYGRWEIIAFCSYKNHHIRWLCRCKCGNEKPVLWDSLQRGLSTSCGCRLAEVTRERSTRHGHAPRGKITQEYRAWQNMLNRCLSPTNTQYADYGGRGIVVCERWQEFTNFALDMGKKPGRTFTLERTNNEGNYEPGNCKWATRKEQARNNRRNIRVTIDGISLVLKDHAERLGIKYGTVMSRLRYGWTIGDALSKPIRKKKLAPHF